MKHEGTEIVIYEPTIEGDSFEGFTVVPDFDKFKQDSDVIVANRLSDELQPVKDKVYTRDLFARD